MISLIQDIGNMISSLSAVDYILFFSVVALIILIVSLIYVLQEEKEEKEISYVNPLESSVNHMENKMEELDLQSIVNIIDEKPKPIIDMTAYEEEQESKAIISYDELINSRNLGELNYDQEELIDDVIPVKRIQVSPIELPKSKVELVSGLSVTQKEPKLEINPVVEDNSKTNLFSYEKEEAFLRALKELNELLNER